MVFAVPSYSRYMYIQAQSPFGDCGGNITDAENGIIKSPNFPEKYTTSSKGSVFEPNCPKTSFPTCLFNYWIVDSYLEGT